MSLGKQQLGTRRSENPRRLRQIRQVEDDPGGDTEDSLEGIQVVKQTVNNIMFYGLTCNY